MKKESRDWFDIGSRGSIMKSLFQKLPMDYCCKRKDILLAQRILIHVAMLRYFRRDNRRTGFFPHRVMRLIRRAGNRLENLNQSILQNKIKHRRKLKAALDRSLKRLNHLLSSSNGKDKKILQGQIRYLQSLVDIRKSIYL